MPATRRARTPKTAEPGPRKLPRQARSRETFDAILDACARLLRAGNYDAVTTNHVAARAGVSIGTLYEFFPNKEAIVATLIERRLGSLLAAVRQDLQDALDVGGAAAVDLLIRRIVDLVASDRELYRVLLRTPSVQQMAIVKRAVAAFFELARAAGGRLEHLPAPEAATWLISRMVYSAVLEIAFLEGGGPDPKVLTAELVRLVSRMIHGRDVAAAGRQRGRSPRARPRLPALRTRAQKPRAARSNAT